MTLARLLLLCSMLLLGGVSVVTIGKIVTDTPAFSQSARQDGVFGDWRVTGHWSMYHQGKYLRALALGFLHADQTSSGVTEGPEDIADPDIALERAAVAADLLRKSLRHSPGQAQSWTSLAWAEALQGNVEEARTALQTSWKIAPFNISQAGSRLALAKLLSDLDDTGMLFDELVRLGAFEDLRTIRRYRGSLYKAMLDSSERYKTLATRESLMP